MPWKQPREILNQLEWNGPGNTCPYCLKSFPTHASDCELDRAVNGTASGEVLFNRASTAFPTTHGCFTCQLAAPGAETCSLFVQMRRILKQEMAVYLDVDSAGVPKPGAPDTTQHVLDLAVTAEACTRWTERTT